jgi:hypothetical protein
MQSQRFTDSKLQSVTSMRLFASIEPGKVAQGNRALGQDLEGMPLDVLGSHQQPVEHGFLLIKQFATVAAIEARCADPLSAQANQAYQHSSGSHPVLSICRIALTLLCALGGRSPLALESSSRGVPACSFNYSG